MREVTEFISSAEDRATTIMAQVFANNQVLLDRKSVTLKQQFEAMNAHGLHYTLSSFKRWNRESASFGNYKTVSLIVITAIAEFHQIREEILMHHHLDQQ